MSFICYKMTHDSGFAPNPFFDVLTLATCKPSIRRTKGFGDWVAGFASKELVNNSKKEGVSIPYQGLVYLMKIHEAKTLDAYFNDPKFEQKKPVKNHSNNIKRSGDNIYYLVNDKYCQLPNNSHNGDAGTIEHDAKRGVNVLIADMSESYYFGRNCPIPSGGWESIGFNFSKGRVFYRDTDSDLKNICNFLRITKRFDPGIHGNPCLHDEREDAPTHGVGCSKK